MVIMCVISSAFLGKHLKPDGLWFIMPVSLKKSPARVNAHVLFTKKRKFHCARIIDGHICGLKRVQITNLTGDVLKRESLLQVSIICC
jgi:hypothetical protein